MTIETIDIINVNFFVIIQLFVLLILKVPVSVANTDRLRRLCCVCAQQSIDAFLCFCACWALATRNVQPLQSN